MRNLVVLLPQCTLQVCKKYAPLPLAGCAWLFPVGVVEAGECWNRPANDRNAVISERVAHYGAGTTVKLNTNVPIGAEMGQAKLEFSPSANVGITCRGNGYLNSEMNPAYAFLGGSPQLYATGLPGVAMSLSLDWLDTAGRFAAPQGYIASRGKGDLAYVKHSDVEITATFIKTDSGPVRAGQLSGTLFYLYATDKEGNGKFDLASYNLQSPLVLKADAPPSCAVDAESKTTALTLQDVKATAFRGQGSTANATPFTLRFTCSGAENGAALRAQIGFTDANSPGNGGNALTLSPKSTAQGVGVQIKDLNGTAYSFGPETLTWDAAGHKTLGDWGDGKRTLSLMAHYVQTGAAIKAGSVNAMATFVMTYQ
ncbi:fimbrial protein [Amantichitinum ursilacus]|uniref:F17b-G fimbrial adhesin n=1 Tax=Amantichitinum ursilacus TaxID=857265 RepID=A0A0N0GQ58_9NEIS|nr:fimbrial protein [Amantichitinum ursilacus]KPC54123.1 F17b-G fimbrial adhesin precursor [Amantichitinum ursilacus]